MPTALYRLTGFLIAWCCCPAIAFAQIPETAPPQGLRENNPRLHALTGARIVVAPGKVIEDGTLLLRDGLIEAVGGKLTIPAGARVWKLRGRVIYAGFIDSYTSLDLPKDLQPPKPRPEEGEANEAKPPEKKAPPAGAAAWNERVTPERNAADALTIDATGTEKLRNLGFTSALSAPGRGVFRGSSALINLGSGDGNRVVLVPKLAEHIAFEQSRFREDRYPVSLMGSIALIRQTFLDADWYRRAQAAYSRSAAGLVRPETNEALAALEEASTAKMPVVFEAQDELDLLRALRLVDEFHLRGLLVGNGYEYRVMDELQAARTPVIVPLDFPGAPEVETPEKALDIPLDELQHWDQAPDNPARLAAAGIPFALTTARLARPEEQFWTRLRRSVRRGLSATSALAALTTTPARLWGVSNRYGTIEPGKVANLVVADGDLFTGKANVLTVWVDGQYYQTDRGEAADPRGSWQVSWSGASAPTALDIKGEAGKPRASLAGSDLTAALDGEQLVLLAPARLFGTTGGLVRLSGQIAEDSLSGTGQLPDGRFFDWSARRTAVGAAADKDKDTDTDRASSAPATYPAGAFGRAQKPDQPEWVLVRGGTLWTSAAAGKLVESDLLVHRGKIARLGPNLVAPAGATVIDARGGHITPGLIDCHSHTAISRGVNEGTHAVTSEVRIGDVLDATDINLYRELAGGLTVANVLHGSANPIGGQNQVIKLRWGEKPEGLKFAGAMPGIKFALGENVKQSFRPQSSRYPQTRMGVEQLLRDNFLAARDYERNFERYRVGATLLPPRRDLQLEALVEILNGRRLVHIHSYRQDEILMFTRLAEQLKFQIGTFQHVLEGYKVADAIARVGAGASSFSDWWGYKVEVYDAIPQNVALMTRVGVVSSVNSDSDDLARRLNTEAAKSIRYGGLSEEEALKLVTINPARQLRIDRQVGSLEVGKDADFVIWSGPPLSSKSRADATWIDGRRYFDRDEDARLRTANAQEHEALVQKALVERQKMLGTGGRAADKPTTPGSTPTLEAGDFAYALEHRSLYHDGRGHIDCSDRDHRTLYGDRP
ncbi:amidohydrolase family protein [Gloeobacter kilaueensis]|uniref:Amidohydrolase n=1 Tax=Gloeobacter kilaueensis (strain ATCC BAA-2537 / CCAP 1431/1 / ULC 316 / JS1) TaxID=1183438 RepID=U5QHF5_GLOK1|nr:amidohydrolase family protein [Gloeobacter kilaueensis]AGY58397.1 amidohydrolase [Gloeobacter kilaueensis JS1]